MKLILWFLIFIGVGIVTIMGISAFLSPDNLSECGDLPSNRKGCGSADAIVAISGGDTPARANEAIKLYQNGWARLLVFSGAAADKSGPSNAEVMKERAIEEGVPPSAILIDTTSETTKQNAVNSTNIFIDHNVHTAILVTSAYHQRRAGLEFKSRVGESVRIINHPVKSDNQWNGWWWLTPTGWWLAIGELVKITVFFAGGSR